MLVVYVVMISWSSCKRDFYFWQVNFGLLCFICFYILKFLISCSNWYQIFHDNDSTNLFVILEYVKKYFIIISLFYNGVSDLTCTHLNYLREYLPPHTSINTEQLLPLRLSQNEWNLLAFICLLHAPRLRCHHYKYWTTIASEVKAEWTKSLSVFLFIIGIWTLLFHDLYWLHWSLGHILRCIKSNILITLFYF